MSREEAPAIGASQHASLTALQRAFQDYILFGADGIAERIEPGRLGNHQRRLAIYRDGYRLRLVEALGTDFDALVATIGKQAFGDARRAYIEATPSVFRNVRWYGAGLATFLRNQPPWREQPWLADIAHFEWTLTLAFDAADAPHVRFEDLAALPADAWGELGLRLHPSVQMIELRANAAAIRMAVENATPPPEPELAADAVTWLVWRKDLSPHFRSLSEPEAATLRAAAEGSSFPALCAGLCEWFAPEEVAGVAAGWLRSWVDEQLIMELTGV
jgi:hypothetical protein